MASSSFLDQYDPLDVIGNGSFGIIRKVRRKADGLVFARKELNFERMSERDRKQIVAEVNILKDLHHDHIVRYHDRYVDRDAGILYILMEYCGGGDLSTVIKQATKQNRPIPEDAIWNYFLQILLALHHCHHPNGHGRSGSGSGSGVLDGESNSRRAQILHRDLKPDNVFLDESSSVKLGDFGLSKALAQTSFANTYVGTPYYMSPELVQEKAYDSKSDIWSLGCLIYELCALKPPFHEAKTHSELSIFIRNGRIPPLPRGYSQSITSVIKSMLNLNPAMRPSAAQLLQHERLELVFKVAETEKMLSVVKSHRATISAREREVLVREQSLLDKEKQITALLGQKDHEISLLQQHVAQMQQTQQYSRRDIDVAIKHAIARREDELRVLIMKREEEVASAMNRREEEIMDAVKRRELELSEAWTKQEQKIREEVESRYQAVEERIEWVIQRESDLKEDETRLNVARENLESTWKKLDQGRRDKNPLEEVKNTLNPRRVLQETPAQQQRRKAELLPTPRPKYTPNPAPLQTPITRPCYNDYMPSAMKGVVLTSTGETLATPSPAELAKLLNCSPKVGLNFAKIFDFTDDDTEDHQTPERAEDDAGSPPPSPTSRKERERGKDNSRGADGDGNSESSSPPSGAPTATATPQPASAPPTRIRRPSIRRSVITRSETLPTLVSEAKRLDTNDNISHVKPLPHPHLRSSGSNPNLAAAARAAILPPTVSRNPPSPEYDFADEENLPSPFLKRIERTGPSKAPAVAAAASSSSSPASSSLGPAKLKKRGSSGLTLRAVAAANNASRRGTSIHRLGPDNTEESSPSTPSTEVSECTTRPSLASARKASEEARKALSARA